MSTPTLSTDRQRTFYLITINKKSLFAIIAVTMSDIHSLYYVNNLKKSINRPTYEYFYAVSNAKFQIIILTFIDTYLDVYWDFSINIF